jgi:hypothetical protein
MARRFCEKCGHGLGDGALFCGGCGLSVPQEQAQQDQPAAAKTPTSLINSRVIGALLAAFFILFTFLGSDSRRDAIIRFIDRNLYEPVEAITPRKTIGEFYSRVRPPCTVADIDFLTGEYRPADCPSSNPFAMLFRVPGAILGTAGYVLSQGPVAVVVVGIPVLLFFVVMIAGMSDEKSWGTYLNPFYWFWTWLIVFPLFTGLFAWGVQLLILALLLMLKSLIAALAFMGIAYFVFEKLKLWDEMRKLFERGVARVGGKRALQQAR